MVSPNVNRILQEMQGLSDAERQELRGLLEDRSARQALVERGLLEMRTPRGKDLERFRCWQPIPIKSKPLSETIIEERRRMAIRHLYLFPPMAN